MTEGTCPLPPIVNAAPAQPINLAQVDPAIAQGTLFQMAAPLKARRIVVAMSGGVDSSVVGGSAGFPAIW